MFNACQRLRNYRRRLETLAFIVVVAALPVSASALTISILDIGDTGTTADGTVFNADPNPSEPATGTGVFEPFVRIEATGNTDSPGTLQNGYNTDTGEPGTNFDTKGGSHWTRSITLGEIGLVERDGIIYYQFILDANEEGRAGSEANQIDITDVQIYLGSEELFANPENSVLGGYTGTAFDSTDNFLLGEAPVWTLDSAINGDVTVILNASICDTPGQCGSGHGDMEMLIPETLFDGLDTDYLVFYTEYERAGRPSGGFEEWSTKSAATPIPEPSAALIFGLGALLVYSRKS